MSLTPGDQYFGLTVEDWNALMGYGIPGITEWLNEHFSQSETNGYHVLNADVDELDYYDFLAENGLDEQTFGLEWFTYLASGQNMGGQN